MWSLDEISHATWNSREHERSKYSSWINYMQCIQILPWIPRPQGRFEIRTSFRAKTLNNTRSLDFVGFSFWWGTEIWQTHWKNGTPPVVLARFGWPWWAGNSADATPVWFPSWKIHYKFMKIHWHHWNSVLHCPWYSCLILVWGGEQFVEQGCWTCRFYENMNKFRWAPQHFLRLFQWESNRQWLEGGSRVSRCLPK